MAQRTVVVIALTALIALPAWGRTPTWTPEPTHTDGPSPTPTEVRGPSVTPTGTPPHPQVHIRIYPDPARSGQRVTLDGSGNDPNQSYAWSQTRGPAVLIENADEPVAYFAVPELTDPATIEVQLGVTSVGQETRGVSVLPADMVLVVIGAGEGIPGGTAAVGVRLDSYGLPVTELEHELGFGAHAPIADRGGGLPDCEVGPGIAATAATFAFVPDGCVPLGTCTGVRASITTSEPIPDAPYLYNCAVALTELPSLPEQYCRFPIACIDGRGRSSSGRALTVRCPFESASVTANYALRPLRFTFSAEPAAPNVGDTVHVRFSVEGEGGLPYYALGGSDPILHGTTTMQPGGGPLGEVTFDLTADCPGTAPLFLQVYYETLAGCPGNTSYYFETEYSPVFPLLVREPGFFRVTGHVAEMPRGCEGAHPYAYVRLDPPGWIVRADERGAFAFDGVPPGEYAVAVVGDCGSFQCWPTAPVSVEDADVDTPICPQRLAAGACFGDCNRDDEVTINELIVGIGMVLGVQTFGACPALDADGDGAIAINEMITAVAASLRGCAAVTAE